MVAVQPNTRWLDKFPWLRYSRIHDGSISFHGCGIAEYVMDSCGAHFLLLPKDELLVNVPFLNWVKISVVFLNPHSKHSYHHFVLLSVNVLKSSIENPASRIDVMVCSALQSRIAENKHIV